MSVSSPAQSNPSIFSKCLRNNQTKVDENEIAVEEVQPTTEPEQTGSCASHVNNTCSSISTYVASVCQPLSTAFTTACGSETRKMIVSGICNGGLQAFGSDPITNKAPVKEFINEILNTLDIEHDGLRTSQKVMSSRETFYNLLESSKKKKEESKEEGDVESQNPFRQNDNLRIKGALDSATRKLLENMATEYNSIRKKDLDGKIDKITNNIINLKYYFEGNLFKGMGEELVENYKNHEIANMQIKDFFDIPFNVIDGKYVTLRHLIEKEARQKGTHSVTENGINYNLKVFGEFLLEWSTIFSAHTHALHVSETPVSNDSIGNHIGYAFAATVISRLFLTNFPINMTQAYETDLIDLFESSSREEITSNSIKHGVNAINLIGTFAVMTAILYASSVGRENVDGEEYSKYAGIFTTEVFTSVALMMMYNTLINRVCEYNGIPVNRLLSNLDNENGDNTAATDQTDGDNDPETSTWVGGIFGGCFSNTGADGDQQEGENVEEQQERSDSDSDDGLQIANGNTPSLNTDNNAEAPKPQESTWTFLKLFRSKPAKNTNEEVEKVDEQHERPDSDSDDGYEVRGYNRLDR